MKTCLHRILGECENCTEDYDMNHHPNNLDCERYYGVDIYIDSPHTKLRAARDGYSSFQEYKRKDKTADTYSQRGKKNDDYPLGIRLETRSDTGEELLQRSMPVNADNHSADILK